MVISASEKDFIKHSIIQDIRIDGRNRRQYRNIKIVPNTIMFSDGSAKVSFQNSTEVLVGVKFDFQIDEETEISIQSINSQIRSDEEKLNDDFFCTVEFSKTDNPKNKNDECLKLASKLSKVLNRSGFINEELLEMREKLKLSVFIDVLVLKDCGNVFDAIMIAVKAAFSTSQIPKFDLSSINNGENENIDAKKLNFEKEFAKLAETKNCNLQKLPICVTINKALNCYFVDASREEEKSADAALEVILDETLTVQALEKKWEGLNLKEIGEMVKEAKDLAKGIFSVYFGK